MDQQGPTYSLLESQLIDAIQQSLQNHIPSNATFLAERLVAQRDCQESRSLLAECYIAENKHYKVCFILKDAKSDANRYKFALSCLKINKLKEAQKALIGPDMKNGVKNYDSIPNGSYGLYLLGVITQKQQRYPDAKDYFVRALQMNPTLWSAYQKLCKLGQNILANKIFTQAKMKTYESGKKQVSMNKKIQLNQDKKAQTFTNNLTKRKSSQSNIQPSFNNIMSLLKKCGDGLYNLIMYNCVEAIEQFKKLPQNHFNTGWVLTSIGRAYMEIVKYTDAVNYYQMAYKLEPHRIQGIDYYSSCLWHLKKNVQLCHLAHQSLQKTLYSPQPWIAVGNCFSLQKQHEQALKFFTRAIQLSPNNAYALSLCGHQHVYNQDFPKAKKMFQNALNYDVRHYSAWWGLGNIAYKQQKYDKAAQSFEKAIGINPKNPVVYSFMGITLAASREYNNALKYFQKSQQFDQKNGLNRFQKANTLVKLQRYDEAVRQLEGLQNTMPKEPQIPMLLGKIYAKLNKKDKAHYYFSIALDLQSKDAQKIKGFIQSLHSGNDNEQMEI